jgi:hypothetical protein
VHIIPEQEAQNLNKDLDRPEEIHKIMKSPEPKEKFKDLMEKSPTPNVYVDRSKGEGFMKKFTRALTYPLPYRLERLQKKQKLLDRVLNIMDSQKKPAFLSNV